MIDRPLTTHHGTLTLRAIRPDETPKLVALRKEAVTLHPTIFGGTPEETEAVDWAERVSHGTGEGDQLICVVEHQRQFVAMAGIFRNSSVKTRHAAFIWGVYVKPLYRGARLVDALVNACVEWAGGKGVTIVRLTVVVSNDKAIAAYRRCGFETTGREVASLLWEGSEYDEYLMVKRLTAPPSLGSPARLH